MKLLMCLLIRHSCFFLIGAFAILLPSCGGSRPLSSSRYIRKEMRFSPALDLVRVQEAKMSDIPVPLSSSAMGKYFEKIDTDIVLGYHDKRLKAGDIKLFYVQEMERWGWRLKEEFSGSEFCVRFKKPDRSCIIFIRPDQVKKGAEFVICAGSKKIGSIAEE